MTIKIKLSIPGFEDNLDLSQFLGESNNRYKNFQFFVNDQSIEEVDFWFVIDDLQKKREQVRVPSGNVIFLSAEVIHPNGYYDSDEKKVFLNQFAHIISCYDIFRDNVTYDLPFLSWMINANHGSSIFGRVSRDLNWFRDFNDIEKTDLISVFCSTKAMTNEHKLRTKFVKAMKNHFGDQLHWYGNGVNSIDQKWGGIAPYKYHIVLENQSRRNVITEKLYDSYLGLSFPIYWGAPNASDYFSSDSFVAIDIYDIHQTIDTIENIFSMGLWETHLPLLIESKRKVLFDYNPFFRIINYAVNTKRIDKRKLKVLYSINGIDRQLPNFFVRKYMKKMRAICKYLGDL